MLKHDIICICAIVAIERFERMDILNGKNTESVNITYNKRFF